MLAGFDSAGDPLYLAVVDYGNRTITCVKDGAATVSVTSNGFTYVLSSFDVLVLRHDPMSSQDYAPVAPGAIDPTGPVFWRKLWPTRDPVLLEDPSSWMNMESWTPFTTISRFLLIFRAWITLRAKEISKKLCSNTGSIMEAPWERIRKFVSTPISRRCVSD